MGKIRTRDDGTLFFDFRYQGCRCREYTRLSATRQNRTRMQKVLNRIESAIELGQFDYETFFPNSKRPGSSRVLSPIGNRPRLKRAHPLLENLSSCG